MANNTNRVDIPRNQYQVKVPFGTHGSQLVDFSPVIARAYELVAGAIRSTPFNSHKVRFDRAIIDKVRDGAVISGSVKFGITAADDKSMAKRATVHINIISGVPIPPQEFHDMLGNTFSMDRLGTAEFLGADKHKTTKPRERDIVFNQTHPIMANYINPSGLYAIGAAAETKAVGKIRKPRAGAFSRPGMDDSAQQRVTKSSDVADTTMVTDQYKVASIDRVATAPKSTTICNKCKSAPCAGPAQCACRALLKRAHQLTI